MPIGVYDHKPPSKTTREKMSKAHSGNKNWNWKEDGYSYTAVHIYMRKHVPKPDLCSICMSAPPQHLANITKIYDRDINNWQWMCAKCHMYFDKRESNLYRGGPKCIDMSNRRCSICKSDKTTTQMKKCGPRPNWCYIDSNLVCMKCYKRVKRNSNK